MSRLLQHLLARAGRALFLPDYARVAGTRRLMRTTRLDDDAIAARSGFKTACEFTAAFTYQYGMSPQEYRQRHAGH